MNKPTRPADLAPFEVTAGPIAGSHKIYDAPRGTPALRVPFREIVLARESGEPPVRLYDASGPYTEDGRSIDVDSGLPRHREACHQFRCRLDCGHTSPRFRRIACCDHRSPRTLGSS